MRLPKENTSEAEMSLCERELLASCEENTAALRSHQLKSDRPTVEKVTGSVGARGRKG